jgi:hypothetical protein
MDPGQAIRWWHNAIMRFLAASVCVAVLLTSSVRGWGVTGHRVIARVAIQTLPTDVPPFLARQVDWIGGRSITPDNYRAASEPFIKMAEDPSHEWHVEAVAFLKSVPRSRVEFIQALYDEHRRVATTDPARARTINVTGTGLLPFTTIEIYERLKVTFRTWRDQQKAGEDTRFTELDAAFYAGWLSHYVADAAMPLHSSIHHDGWIGENPRNYARSGELHWGFENDFVNLMELSDDDVRPRVTAARALDDPFTSILEHVGRAHTRVEQVYQLEQQRAFGDRSNAAARALVLTCTSEAATMLRDLVYTAWVSSAQPAAPRTGIVLPNDPSNPRFNPAAGSAPAPSPVR